MGKSSSTTQTDVNTVLRKLKIRRDLFTKQVQTQTRFYEEIVGAELMLLATIDKALESSLKHLSRAQTKLGVDAISTKIGSGLSTGRQRDLVKTLSEGDLFGIPKCACAVRRAFIRVETCLGNLARDLGKRREMRAAVSTCIAAAKLESAIRTVGLKQIGYHGALCLHALGREPNPPKSTSKLDNSVNRF